MRTWRTVLAAAVLMLAIAGPARADWKWTKWGMTPQQVIAASRGAAQPVETRPDLLSMDGPIKVAGYSFAKVLFHFDSRGGLAEVQLFQPNADFETLSGAMRSAMGAPIKIEKDALNTEEYFRDRPAGDIARLGKSVNIIIVTYSPNTGGS